MGTFRALQCGQHPLPCPRKWLCPSPGVIQARRPVCSPLRNTGTDSGVSLRTPLCFLVFPWPSGKIRPWKSWATWQLTLPKIIMVRSPKKLSIHIMYAQRWPKPDIETIKKTIVKDLTFFKKWIFSKSSFLDFVKSKENQITHVFFQNNNNSNNKTFHRKQKRTYAAGLRIHVVSNTEWMENHHSHNMTHTSYVFLFWSIFSI